MLSFSATTRGDTARKDGEETQQNRDAHVGQELHNGPDKRHMRNAWGGATVHVSKSYIDLHLSEDLLFSKIKTKEREKN